MEQQELTQLLEVCALAAHAMLENGGETYRAEETVLRICTPYPEIIPQVLALPTGVFITLAKENSCEHTTLRRVRKRTVNLGKIHACNKISRRLERQSIPLLQAKEEFLALLAPGHKKSQLPLWAAALSSGFFAMMFGGGLPDFLAALLAGALVGLISMHFRRNDLYHFIISVMGGLLISGTALLLAGIVNIHIAAVIAGAMMPLLPGLAMTNAIRDTMHGDLVSGVSRAADAALVSVSLAGGAGLGMWLYHLAGGVLP